MGYMKKGGMAKKGMKEGGDADITQDKKMAKKAVGMHEKQLHGGKKSDLDALKKGGKVKKMAFGGRALPPRGGAPMRTGPVVTKGMMMDAKPRGRFNKGGMAKCAKGGGIEVRGKTKGKMC